MSTTSSAKKDPTSKPSAHKKPKQSEVPFELTSSLSSKTPAIDKILVDSQEVQNLMVSITGWHFDGKTVTFDAKPTNVTSGPDCHDDQCHCLEYRKSLEDVRRKLEQRGQQDFEARTSTLIKQEQYAAAEASFRETISLVSNDYVSDTILDLKSSFIKMQLKRSKVTADLATLAKDVFEKRMRTEDTMPEKYKESHRQLCKVLCLEGKYDEAARMHRAIYDESNCEEWSLENGDDLCQVWFKQGVL